MATGIDDSDNRSDAIARLVRRAEPAGDPIPVDAEKRVRAAVEEQWRITLSARSAKRQRRTVLAGMAASMIAALAWWVAGPRSPEPAPGPVLATLERVTGNPLLNGTALSVTTAGVRQGDVLLTGGGDRLSLALAPGVSLRLDRRSELRVTGPSEVYLVHGGLYVDSGPAAPDFAVTVASQFGVARDIGTQFELRVDAESLLVRVREGQVEVQRDALNERATAGEALRIERAGDAALRMSIDRQGASWDWTQTVAPEFPIDGATLADFLLWAARETGRELEFDSTAARDFAQVEILRGDLAGTTPEQALDSVLRTTPSAERIELGRDRIRVRESLQ